MQVTVLISSYDRGALLLKCIKSIVECNYKDVSIFVVVDGNRSFFTSLLGKPVNMILNDKRMDYIFSMNRALMEMGDTDAVLYASDDLEFDFMCITEAVNAMRDSFPDGDGLIAIKQDCPGEQSAFGLMGRKFIERFPNRQVFCPDYIHFASDSELGEFARSIRKYRFCAKAKVHHSRLEDKTTQIGKNIRSQDKTIRKNRKIKGLLWGKTFEKLGK